MNISELIEELIELKEEHGDLDVTVWADHGQWNMKASAVGVQFRDENGDCVGEEDLDDEEEGFCREDYEKVIEVS